MKKKFTRLVDMHTVEAGLAVAYGKVRTWRAHEGPHTRGSRQVLDLRKTWP